MWVPTKHPRSADGNPLGSHEVTLGHCGSPSVDPRNRVKKGSIRRFSNKNRACGGGGGRRTRKIQDTLKEGATDFKTKSAPNPHNWHRIGSGRLHTKICIMTAFHVA